MRTDKLGSIVRDRIRQIEQDGGHRLWIGTQTNPDDRLQIVVSQADVQRIPARGSRGRAQVTDMLTGKALTVRRALDTVRPFTRADCVH